MLLPSIFEDDLFNNWLECPTRDDLWNVDNKLYGKRAANLMKTDIHENEHDYEIDIDLPGFKKEEINLALDKGYLTVKTDKGINKEEKNEKGKVIRKERYSGTMQRSFYIGDEIKTEDIKAKYEDGVLKLVVPKKAPKEVCEKKYIAIE